MIRILIVDPSPALRAQLAHIIAGDPELQVVGEARDGQEALAFTRERRPNLILMSADLPRMDGFEATRSIMTEAPTPIVILSEDLDVHQVELSMHALRAGAVSVHQRPNSENSGLDLVRTVKAMAQVKLVRRWPDRPRPLAPASGRGPPQRRVVAIGASTGGPAAVQQILSSLPGQFPLPILLVQHIAVGFLSGFVNWLNTESSLKVKIAEHGESLVPRTVYVARDDRHLGIDNRSTIAISAAPPIGGFRPSATFLFESVTKNFGASAINVILTGMGQDGLKGLQAARASGGYVLAQDEESSVVFGMPGSVVNAGIASAVLPLSRIAAHLVELVEGQSE
jgi:two-component system chemotaxis response regulator CheB